MFVGSVTKFFHAMMNFPYNDALKRVDFSGVAVGSPRSHNEHKDNAIDTLRLKATTQSCLLIKKVNT